MQVKLILGAGNVLNHLPLQVICEVLGVDLELCLALRGTPAKAVCKRPGGLADLLLSVKELVPVALKCDRISGDASSLDSLEDFLIVRKHLLYLGHSLLFSLELLIGADEAAVLLMGLTLQGLRMLLQLPDLGLQHFILLLHPLDLFHE